MKLLSLGLVLIASQQAFAGASVGDWARYEGDYSYRGSTGTATLLYSVTDVSADGSLRVHQTVSANSSRYSDDEVAPQDSIVNLSRAALEKLVSSSTECAGRNGKLQTILFEGKPMPTCKINAGPLDIWAAPVPLGMVKFAGTVNGAFLDATLVEAQGVEYPENSFKRSRRGD